MKIKQEVLSVLSTIVTEGSNARIVDTLDRKLYVKVNEVLEACGGKWNRKAKAHVFTDDCGPILDAVMVTGEVATHKDIGFFPTPKALASELVEMAGVQDGDVVLEPSAGTGRLVEAIQASLGTVFACERDPKMREALPLSKDFVFPVDDFLDLDLNVSPIRLADGRTMFNFDRVVMNPPFCKVGKGDHLDHVRRAFQYLVKGGTLVSVLPSSVTFRQDRRYKEFRSFVKDNSGEIKDLPEGSFQESGTGVNTCVVRMVHS